MSYAQDKERIAGAPHYYALLGVHLHSTDAEIGAARRKLAREFHPDINGDPAAVGIMAEINRAADTLLAGKYAYTLKGPACAVCKGEGCSRKQRGYTRAVIVQCPTCKGAGRVVTKP